MAITDISPQVNAPQILEDWTGEVYDAIVALNAAAAGPPNDHAARHGVGGVDPVTVAQSQVSGLATALAALLPLAGGAMTGPLVLDGDPTADLGAATRQYVDAAILASLADIDAGSVATQQGTGSGSYVALATAGPSATVEVGATGRAIVSLSARLDGGPDAYMSVAATGANTIAASDTNSIFGENGDLMSGLRLITGLTPGVTTFTALYRRVGIGAADFADRRLMVITL